MMKRMTLNHAHALGHKDAGGALLGVILLTSVVTVLAGTALTIAASSNKEVEHERRRIQALYSAEAGVNAGLAQLTLGWKTAQPVSATLGTDVALAGESNNAYFTSITENVDGSYTIQATGRSGAEARSIEVLARPYPPSPFEHAMYAGNLSGDATYDLELGGTGSQADTVVGDLYSGGDLTLADDATVTGDLSASGILTGATGTEGLTPQLPQLLEIDYENFNDYDVAALFGSSTRISDNAGGTAGQLPSTDAAHIFRLNPSDRSSDTSATTKDDYFLEDPYESVNADYGQDGSNAFEVSLPADANNKVYFIDGNLWLHNRRTYSLKIKNEGVDPTKVTFVVKGNVYFSDNFFYSDPAQDGVSFIALADENVADSGNVYFGDPSFGTMQFAEAFIFAENNFYDTNLSAAGSSNVEVRGSMTAGNQMDIQRDFLSAGTLTHTQLKLTYDERQSDGSLNLPGIPSEVDQPGGFLTATWREVPTPDVYTAPPAATLDVEAPSGLSFSAGSPGSGDWRERWDTDFPGWRTQKRTGKWNP